MMIKAGITKQISKTVSAKDTATAYGSGVVEVFATPAMIALMEETALKSVEPFLEDNQTTVGFEINIRHFKAVRVGEEVISTCLLQEVVNKKLVFEVDVMHKDETVGKGQHIRYIVDKDQFS